MSIFRNVILRSSAFLVAVSLLPLQTYAHDEQKSPFVSTEVNNLPYDRGWLDILKREKGTSFKDERLKLVYCNDVSGNCLFRSNVPVKDGAFAYDHLVQAMQSAYEGRYGKPLPEKFELVDVSLLNWFTDAEAIKIEQNYFKHNPEKGRMIHHPIYGALFSPSMYPEMLQDWLEQIPSFGEIGSLEDNLGQIVSTAGDRPQMVLVHCRGGHDRTGEVIAAYQMRYLGISYRTAYAQANAAAKGVISPYSRNGLEWYAYYLRDVLGIHTVGEIDDI